MRIGFTALLFSAFLYSCHAQKDAGKSAEKRKLLWSDEFNYTGLPDSTKWDYETGGHGWGNNELQFYTARDTATALVQNGRLHITAAPWTHEKNPYRSARLVTRGKQLFCYGRIDVRAKFTPGRGTWPAIWMLGSNIKEAGWPRCGEIDIMEHVGYMPDSVFGSVHTESYNHVKRTQTTKGVYMPKLYDDFHVYSVDWTAERIVFLVDDKPYLQFANEHKSENEWPFSQPFYLLLNFAAGGNWGGAKGVDPASFPAAMQVDYVRVYEPAQQ